MQSDLHGSMTLLSNLEQSLVHWSFEYNVNILELSVLSRSWEGVTTEGTETLRSLLRDIYNAS